MERIAVEERRARLALRHRLAPDARPPTRSRRCARWSRSTRATRRRCSSRHGRGRRGFEAGISSASSTSGARSSACLACGARSGSSRASSSRSSTRPAPGRSLRASGRGSKDSWRRAARGRPGAWLDERRRRCPRALEARGEAFTSDLSRADRVLATKMRLGAAPLGDRGERRKTPPPAARGRGNARARPPARKLDERPVPLGPERRVAGRGARAAGSRGGAGRAPPPLARRVRPGDGDRHPLVDGLDGTRGARGARRRPARRRRARRGDRLRPRGRRRADPAPAPWVALLPRSTRPRWAGRSAPGTSEPTARSSTRTATRGRRSGATAASSAAGRSARTARSSGSCSRTSAPTLARPSRRRRRGCRLARRRPLLTGLPPAVPARARALTSGRLEYVRDGELLGEEPREVLGRALHVVLAEAPAVAVRGDVDARRRLGEERDRPRQPSRPTPAPQSRRYPSTSSRATPSSLSMKAAFVPTSSSASPAALISCTSAGSKLTSRPSRTSATTANGSVPSACSSAFVAMPSEMSASGAEMIVMLVSTRPSPRSRWASFAVRSV